MAKEPYDVSDAENGLRPLLEHLRDHRGFDFSGYKRASLERRIKRRLDAIGIDNYRDYQDYLEVTPDEFTELFNTILINVTGFFRDKPAWDYVASEIIPALLESVPEQESIRVWSAACSSGEEAYTLAMLFVEALGDEEFKRRVKIFATDVDEEALNVGRQATYPADAIKSVPPELAERYFETTPLGRVF